MKIFGLSVLGLRLAFWERCGGGYWNSAWGAGEKSGQERREGASEGILHPRRAQGAHFPILQLTADCCLMGPWAACTRLGGL